jgi:hypothetical protein
MRIRIYGKAKYLILRKCEKIQVGLSVDNRPIKEGNDDKDKSKSVLKTGVGVDIQQETFVK